jgi:tRNA(Arg) A34 adenosine deaminase TadA
LIKKNGVIEVMLDCCLELPSWCRIFLSQIEHFESDEDKMMLAVELSKQNVLLGTGGPFGAAVFDGAGRVVSVGVNVVESSGCSVAHAEMMALMLGQRVLGRHRLNGVDGVGEYVLATSAQPCSMCFGALPWAGIDRLVCGATREDVEDIAGFDEGPLPADWQGELAKCGISVVTGVLQEEAAAVLKEYRGKVY